MIRSIAKWFINLYAVWILVAFVIGYLFPESFMWFAEGKIHFLGNSAIGFTTIALSIVMLAMGLTLKVDDFRELFRIPRVVIIAAVSQYTVMPLSGWLIAKILGLPPELAVGLILVACCPGGTASNMIAYIGRANVALSVISTAVSTVLGIFMTPLLCKFLAGQIVEVDAWGMFFDVIKIVLIPVALGVFINYKFPSFVKKLGQTGPVLSTIAIIFISGGIIAPQDKAQIPEYAASLLLASFMLHSFGFGLGYGMGRLFKYDHSLAKAISCETGMQNGGLAAVLAKNTFPAYMPLVALPSAFCSIMQTAVGGVLATIWRFTSKEK